MPGSQPWFAATALLLLGSLAVDARAFHGAVFPPPKPGGGDSPPPSPPGPSPNGPPPAGNTPGSPTPGATAAPAPASTRGSAGSSATPMPGSTGGARTATPAIPASAVTGAVGGLEATSWELWWRYNRDAFLDLKERVESTAPATLDDGGAGRDARVARGLDAAIAALARERQRDLVSGLLVAVARSCDDAALARGAEISKTFAPFLADPDQEIGETAAAALGILRHHAAIPSLVALLHDDERGRELANGRVSARTRAFSAYALAIAAARSPREDLRAFVAHHLQRALESSRGSATADLAAACVIALGIVPMGEEAAIGQPRKPSSKDEPAPRSRAGQVAALLEVLHDKERADLVRAHVPDSLARLAIGATTELRAAVVRELASVLERQQREDAGVVRGAVLALGRLGDADQDDADLRIRGTLKRALDADDGQARLFALISMAQVASRAGSTEDDSAVQSDVQAMLLEKLARGRARERSWSALGVGILERARTARGREPSHAVRAALRRALADTSAPDQVGALAIGIGLCGDRGASRDLIAKLDTISDPVGRGHIATAIGLLQSPEGVAPLRAILAKSRFQPDLLRETAIGLALLGDVDLEAALLDELRNAKSLSSQAGIARALGFAGTLATVEPLVKMLDDASLSAGARAFSAVALGMVCDRERTPWNAFLSIGVNYPSAPASLSDGSAGILDIL